MEEKWSTYYKFKFDGQGKVISAERVFELHNEVEEIPHAPQTESQPASEKVASLSAIPTKPKLFLLRRKP